MSDSIRRVVAIVRADFLLRFRRLSTVIVFLLLSAFAYVWIPSPSTGRALIQIDGHRAIYNSGAIGMGTATLGMMFVGLFGYYVISNAIRRDIVSRCGAVVASTPMRSLEYLLAKFVGNVAFLVTFLGGFMLSSMAMLIVRGEAPIQPLVFIQQYLLLTPAAIIFVSAVAVLFESIRFLSGKIGDVFYFFFWMAFFSLAIGDQVSGGKMNWSRCFDFSGFGFMISQMTQTLGTESVSIGASAFDPAKEAILFPGLRMTPDWIAPRIISMLLPLAFLPLAGLFFHRFDPVRTRRTSDKTHRNWIGKLQSLFKPLSRYTVARLMPLAGGRSFGSAIVADTLLTITLIPLIPLVFLGITGWTIMSGWSAPGLPIMLAAIALTISDVATRDVRSGTSAILFAAPQLRERFAILKLGSAFLLSLLLAIAPLVQASGRGAKAVAALVTGLLLISALSTALGVISGNAKTYIVVFLSFWYVVVNDRGASPLLDFAGLYNGGNEPALLLYAAITVVAVIAALIAHHQRLKRS